MGNADSHSTVVAAAPPSCSLRFSSKGDEVPSARSWWRSNQAGGRSRGGRSLKQTPQRSSRGSGRSTLGRVDSGAEGSGVCGERTSQEGGGSPKVLLSKDGSTRVEFTNSRVVAMEPEGFTSITTTAAAAAVPDPSLRTSKGSLLSSDGSWYDSPWGGSAELVDNGIFCRRSADPSSGYATYASHRSENTATSDGTYTTIFSARVENISPGFNSTPLFPTADTDTAGYTTCSSGRTEDSGIGDSLILPPDLMNLNLISLPAALIDIGVYSSHNALPAFPTVPDTPHTSFSSTTPCLDDVIQEEQDAGGAVGQRYSSLTLPCRRSEPICSTTTRNNRKDFLKSRIQQLSDWTGSLSRKKRRIQEPYGGESTDVFTNRLTGGLVSSGAVWSSDQLHTMNYFPVVNPSSNDQRQNIYENFMQELETSCGGATNHTEPSEGEEEDEEEIDGEVKLGGGEQLDLLLEKEQGVVRRAGWLSFKALITISKDGKVELVARRKWRNYWVTLKGCTLLFHETYGRGGGGEHELSPHYALLAEDSIVQAIPEHPKKEHVFCLSNSYGDVYLFQATNQTDLENWVTAVHSASAALLARQQGKEDTLRLLRVQSRSLLHKIDMDGKMKKMAELQLSIIKEHKNRKAVESQIQQWDQNLEKLNLDLFRLRCYLSSLQGGELPNPKSLLAVVSRASKSTLGRLGVFSVSSFHALVCSRDEEVLRRRRRRSLSGGNSKRRSLLSSLKTLDKHNLNTTSTSSQVWDEPSVPVLGVFSLLLSRPDAQDFGLAVTGHVDGVGKSRVYVSEVDPRGLSALEGLRVGDQVLAVNGASVSALDLHLLQNLFTHQRLHLLLRRDASHDPEVEPAPTTATAAWLEPADTTTWATDDSSLSDFAPPPAFDDITLCASGESTEQNMDRVYSLLQSFPEGRAADADVPKNPYDREAVFQPASPAHLSVCQRLRKVIEELVDTEKSYVKDLVCLLDLYLTPLQNETFLSKEEMEALFGSLPEMLDFQRVFLQTLEEKIMSCPNFSRLEKPEHFKKLLFSLGGSFLYYADHFKLYSGFCANHIKVQKVLERAKTDDDFKRFLETRNPTNQHSTCLESFLIKPVQRVLKYPLLLRELMVLTQRESPEHTHLTEALRAMEKVATHINEMQKIYEDFGCVFEQLAAEQSGRDKQVSEISMGEFLVRSSAVWLNPLPSLGRMRKEPELTLFVFKRAVILVYRENSKLKKRMNAVRSADPDPLRFCWLIPPSAVQVRPAKTTGSESACVWELVHSRSEVEGHPETVFQLRSSGLESKASVLRSLRSVLRERASAASLRRTRLSTAERRRQQRSRVHGHRATRPLEDRCMLGETCSEPLLPSHAMCDVAGKKSRLCSLTSDLEAQLQRLNFTEEEVEPGAANHSDSHKVAEKRRSSSLQRGDTKDASSERHFRVTSVHTSTE